MQFVGSQILIDSSDRDDKINSLAFRRRGGHITVIGEPAETPASPKRREAKEENVMNWVAPIVEEICVGMEVTSYESADIEVLF